MPEPSRARIVAPRVFTVCEWGGRQIDNGALPTVRPSGILIHHTAGPSRPTLPNDLQLAKDKGFDLARQIQQAHMARGWRDSGQHFLVTRDGLILEGRCGALVHAQAGLVLQGAHAGDAEINRKWFGIENEGTYTSDLPPPAQWTALVALCAWLSVTGGTQAADIRGHREVARTLCPGDKLFDSLQNLRDQVRQRKLLMMAGR